LTEIDRVKIILAGPKDSGKTCIANYLGNLTPELTPTSRPTIGVRIVEFERTGLKLVKQKAIQRDGKVLVELWDVSGEKNFQACWPSICKDAQGLLLAFNPDARNAEKDIEFWYKSFNARIKDSSCLVLAHHRDEESAKTPTKLRKSDILSNPTLY
jgi:Rab-like protein 5